MRAVSKAVRRHVGAIIHPRDAKNHRAPATGPALSPVSTSTNGPRWKSSRFSAHRTLSASS